MDLNTIGSLRQARSREDLRLAPGETFLAGGTWMFSEPQYRHTGLVDLTTMGWPAIEYTEHGLRIASTCTIAELSQIPPREGWAAHPIFFTAATALLASFKIWNVATVGGNICRAYCAAAMTTMAVTLDAEALIWAADGRDYTMPVEAIGVGNGISSIPEGDVLRAIDIPTKALRGRTALRKVALAEIGRSGAVLTGRLDEDASALFAITAATLGPVVLRYPGVPSAAVLERDVLDAPGYYTDPLGSADWRRGTSAVLMEEIRQEFVSWS